jgi:hypothetical protein
MSSRKVCFVACVMLLGTLLPSGVAGAANPGPQVRTFAIDASTGAATQSGSAFEAFPIATSIGANVAAGNLDGDNADELAFGTTEGSTNEVAEKEANGTAIRSFPPYSPTFQGGAYVAVGNLDADPEPEIVTGAGPGGGPHVKVLNADGTSVTGFFAYSSSFTGGVRVAVGDVTGDGANEIITGNGPGIAADVRVFTNQGTPITNFNPYPGLGGGVSVAVGELEGGGKQEIVTGTHSQQVRVFDGAGTSLHDILVPGSPQGDVRVAVGPLNGTPHIITASDDATTPVGIYSATGSRVGGFDPSGGTDSRDYSVAVANDKVVTAETGGRLPPREGQVTTSPAGGGGPHVRTRPVPTGAVDGGFMAYEPTFNGGVNVARGDIDGDGVDEIVTGAGPGRPSLVRVFTPGGAQLSEFVAYPGFSGGVDVAVGDLDGDGLGEIVTGAGAGGLPHVRIFDDVGTDLTGGGFVAYVSTFHGGVRVATGDLDGDGADEIVTGPGAGGGPHVKVFLPDGQNVAGFMAYAPAFTGGVDVAAGDVDGDGAEDVITGAGPGGGPHVRFFDPVGTELGGLMAYSPDFHGGVRVSSLDADNDGVAEVVTGPGAGGGPHVRVFQPDGVEVVGYMAYGSTFSGGVDVAGGGV